MLTQAVTANPITTAIIPALVGPLSEEASPKLCAKAAPAIKPVTVIAESVLPSPVKMSWRQGQPPRRTLAQPTNTIPSAFHNPSVCATACPANPSLN